MMTTKRSLILVLLVVLMVYVFNDDTFCR